MSEDLSQRCSKERGTLPGGPTRSQRYGGQPSTRAKHCGVRPPRFRACGERDGEAEALRTLARAHAVAGFASRAPPAPSPAHRRAR